MSRPWIIEDEVLEMDNPYLKVKTQRVRLPSGARINDFHVIESPPWAATLAVTEDDQLVLVEQYRHAHGGSSLELPAGVIEPDESPIAAAARELEEETGFVAPSVEPLWRTRPEPSRHRQWAHFFVARGARAAVEARPEATEDLRVVLRPLSEWDAIIDEMVHGVHVAALLLAQHRGLLTPRGRSSAE